MNSLDLLSQRLASHHLEGASENDCSAGLLSFAPEPGAPGLKLNDAASAAPIVQRLQANRGTMETFQLQGNTLGVEAARVIGAELKYHPQLKRAMWGNLFTGRSKEELPIALKALLDGVQAAGARLIHLDLSDNALGPNGMRGLRDFMESRAAWKLEKFYINNTGLGITGCKMLVEVMEKCLADSSAAGCIQPLREFIAGRNRLENEGAVLLASRIFSKLTTLELLAMPQNGIHSDGIEMIAKALARNPNMQHLNLSDNTAKLRGACAIAKALPHLPQLSILRLDDCLLKTKGCVRILEALKSNKSLRCLHISGNELTAAVIDPLIESLKYNAEFEKLDINTNQLGARGVQQLKDGFRAIGFADTLESLSEDEGSGSEDEEEEETEGEEEEEEEEHRPQCDQDVEPPPQVRVEPSELDQLLCVNILGNMSQNDALLLVRKCLRELVEDPEEVCNVIEKLAVQFTIDNREYHSRIVECFDALIEEHIDSQTLPQDVACVNFANCFAAHIGLLKSEYRRGTLDNVSGRLEVARKVAGLSSLTNQSKVQNILLRLVKESDDKTDVLPADISEEELIHLVQLLLKISRVCVRLQPCCLRSIRHSVLFYSKRNSESQTIREIILSTVYSHWDSYLPTIRHECNDLFALAVSWHTSSCPECIASTACPLMDSTTHHLLHQVSPHIRARYSCLTAVLQHRPKHVVATLFEAGEEVVDVLKLIHDQTISNYICYFVVAVFERMTDDSAEYRRAFDALTDLLLTCDDRLFVRLANFLPKLHAACPSLSVMLCHTLRDMPAPSYRNQRAVLAVAQLALGSGELAAHWSELVEGEVLSKAVHGDNVDLGLRALHVVLGYAKTTEAFSAFELSLMRDFLQLNCASTDSCFRPKLVSAFKRFLFRFRDSGNVLLRNGDGESMRRYEDFITWLTHSFLPHQFFPSSSFGRRSTALLLLDGLCEYVNGQRAQILIHCGVITFLSSRACRAIIDEALKDSFETNQKLALELMGRLPARPDCEPDPMELTALFKSNKPQDADATAYTLVMRYASKPLLLLRSLLRELQSHSSVARSSLVDAARAAPMFNVLRCVRAVAEAGYVSGIDVCDLQPVIASLVDLCLEIAALVSPVVNNISPEGHLPTEVTEKYLAMSDRSVTSKVYSITCQMILVCCWRSQKELSAVLASLYARRTDCFDAEQATRIGSSFVTQLQLCNHRGAFETTYYSFVQLCTVLWRSSNQQLSSLPPAYLHATLTELRQPDATDRFSVTRRGAGVPFLVQTVIATAPKESTPALLSDTVTTLKEMVAGENDPQQTVHALNVLRALVRDSTIGFHMHPHVPTALLLCLDCLAPHRVWAQRNSATLLFSALLTRMFGVTRSREGGGIGEKNSLSWREFNARYATLLDSLYERMRTIVAEGCFTRFELVPLLVILQRIYPSQDTTAQSVERFALCTARIALHSPVWTVRELSADVTVRLLAVNEETAAAVSVALADRLVNSRSNVIHSITLILEQLLRAHDLNDSTRQHIAEQCFLCLKFLSLQSMLQYKAVAKPPAVSTSFLLNLLVELGCAVTGDMCGVLTEYKCDTPLSAEAFAKLLLSNPETLCRKLENGCEERLLKTVVKQLMRCSTGPLHSVEQNELWVFPGIGVLNRVVFVVDVFASDPVALKHAGRYLLLLRKSTLGASDVMIPVLKGIRQHMDDCLQPTQLRLKLVVIALRLLSWPFTGADAIPIFVFPIKTALHILEQSDDLIMELSENYAVDLTCAVYLISLEDLGAEIKTRCMLLTVHLLCHHQFANQLVPVVLLLRNGSASHADILIDQLLKELVMLTQSHSTAHDVFVAYWQRIAEELLETVDDATEDRVFDRKEVSNNVEFLRIAASLWHYKEGREGCHALDCGPTSCLPPVPASELESKSNLERTVVYLRMCIVAFVA